MDLQLLGFLAIGLAAGWLSGLMGIGGGIIIVPALMFIYGFSLRDAQGTSLGSILAPVGILAAVLNSDFIFSKLPKSLSMAVAKLPIGILIGLGDMTLQNRE